MKVNTNERQILTNSNNESQFTINASAHAFKILSDGLYEHKIAAIVRELSCNAFDSHVEAGIKETPFKVVLPNNLHPYFEIEDYGIGLDDEGVREVYTSYFTSTKQDSNDAIGAFGLGSKTPFSYTSNFTIQARQDGVERLYSAYLNASGAPCVNMMSESETDKSNGVKVTIPVKEVDIYSFECEARFVLSFFSPQPTVTDPHFEFAYGDGLIDRIKEEKIVFKERYKLSPLYSKTMYAVMGGVCYPLSNDFDIQDSNVEHYIKKVMLRDVSMYYGSKNCVFFHFDIGDLEVAASRETLSLTEYTKKNINQKVEQYAKVLMEQDQKDLELFNHPVSAFKHIADKYGGHVAKMGPFNYKDRTLNDVSYERVIVHYHGVYFAYDTSSRHHKNKKLNKAMGIDIEQLATTKKVKGLYYNEGERKSYLSRYLKDQLLERPLESITVICDEPTTEHQRKRIETLLARDIEWYNLQDLKDQYPINNTKASSTRVSRRVESKEVRTTYMTLSKENGLKSHSECIVGLNSNVLYVDKIERSEGLVYINHGTYNSTWFNACRISPLLDLMGDNEELILIPNNGRTNKKISKYEVKSFSDYLTKKVDENKKLITDSILWKDIFFDTMSSTYQYLSMPTKLKDDSKYNDLCDLMRNKPENDDFDAFGRMGLIDITSEKETYNELVYDFVLMFEERYPMLKLFSNHVSFRLSSFCKEKAVQDYIKLVDSQ